MYEKIPAELKQLKQWGLFKLERRGDKITKLPINAHDGSMAKSNDPETWATFDQAMAALDKFPSHGLGFFFAPPYVGIDLDDIRIEIERFRSEDHEKNIVSEFVEMLGTYAEVSVSGNGVHLILKGSLPDGGRRKGNVEMYSEGRFFAMTGIKLGDATEIVEDDRGQLAYLHDKYIGSRIPVPTREPSKVDLSENRIIEIAQNSKNGLRFQLFMRGGWEQFYSSQSEADMAFANDLAFWCDRDFEKMDEIFRRSSLFREKWDEKRKNTTYGAETLNKAIAECENVFRSPVYEDPNHIEILDQNIEEIPITHFTFDDTGNADRLIEAYGDILRFNYQLGSWFYYDGRVWQEDQQGFVRILIDDVVEKMAKERIYAADDEDKEAIFKAFQKHLKTSRSNRGKEAMQKLSQHRGVIFLSDLDSDPYFFNTMSGILDLKTGKLLPHDRRRYLSKISRIEIDSRRGCPTWLQFLDRIFDGDQDLIKYVQRAVGYSMIGTTEEQKMFILFGKGRNGKSVFLDIISELFGNYGSNIQPQSLMHQYYQGTGSSPNGDIARLDGARFVTTTETSDGHRLDEAKIKQLTGGDRITARFAYSRDFEYRPQFAIWMATNYKPEIRGTDDGIWRRLSIIPFNVQIPEEDVDPRLTFKLKKELGAILKWALDGCLEWQRIGLDEPFVAKKELHNYRSEMNVVEQFLKERCVKAEGKSVEGSLLYQAYKRWAGENNEFIMSGTKFGREASKLLQRKKASSIFYLNIRLLSDPERPFLRLSD